MEDNSRVRMLPFLVGLAVLVIVTVALFRLPEEFVVQLRRNRPFQISQSGWVFRGLVLAALAQAAYVGFVLLRPERVQKLRETDPRLSHMTRAEIMSSLARNAAVAPLLTVVYGLSAFGLTGERAGFWLFFAISVAQMAWHYRQVGEISGWMAFQPEFASPGPVTQPSARPPSPAAPPDPAPPLARGLEPDDPELP